jgi:hypothetical protein
VEQHTDVAGQVPVECGVEQAALAPERVVQARPADAGARLEVSDVGVVVAALPEQVTRGVDDRLGVVAAGPAHLPFTPFDNSATVPVSSATLVTVYSQEDGLMALDTDGGESGAGPQDTQERKERMNG